MSGSGTRKASLLAVSCVLLAGCGSATHSSAGAPAGARPGVATTSAGPVGTATAGGGSGGLACGLVSEQDASTAIGSAAGPPKSGGTAALSECIYDDGALIIGMKADGKALYDKSRKSALAKGATDVPGVGDSAFLVSFGKAAMIYFNKGTTLVNISLAVDSGSASPPAIEVAKVAAAHL